MEATEFKLSSQQVRFFRTFGFLRLPGLLKDDIGIITKQFHTVFDNNSDDIVDWVHETHENRIRRFIPNFIDRDSYLSGLKDDYRIRSINETLIGADIMYRGSDGNFFECGTRWHNDSYGADISKTNIKYGIYLDEIDAESGALRFLPGTHHFHEQYAIDARTNLVNPEESLGLRDEDVPAIVYPNTPGDVMVWDYRTMHATCYKGNTRRLIAIDFSEPY